ncbi:hypothetical protein [Burkholderia sp. Ac-20353]|uniref:hypothetical protein n=1 Tax=Burkholderia sp. Ac-20353 TaxID=2703894 RepID=UPI00197C23E7|nr:hypothetical protein [Burkholderia sp. Ac-20353]MBN3785629.1 hypothetical protein [Burkholderia sp. Ac-20353]
MNGMTNLVILMIAMHGSAPAPTPVYRHAGFTQSAAEKRSTIKTDAIVCKDGRVRTFPLGQPRPCS